jgi:hypothetical protein
MSQRNLGPVQKIIARRMIGQRLAESESMTLRSAVQELDAVTSRSTPAMLAAAGGLPESAFQSGVYSEGSMAAVIQSQGVAMPVGAIGDGAILKWLFSDEGRQALMAWVETIMKIIAILGPLFAGGAQSENPPRQSH